MTGWLLRTCWPALLWLGDVACAGSLPWEGHAVTAERIGAALQVNGLPVDVWRLAGPGLQGLTSDVALTWRAAPGFSDRIQGRWRIVARLHGGQGEVLQYDATAAEALFSRFDPSAVPRRPRRPALLPAGCTAGGLVEDRNDAASLLQVSARCAAGIAGVEGHVRARARSLGLREVQRGAGPLVFERGGAETRVFLEPLHTGTSLVLVQWSPRRSP